MATRKRKAHDPAPAEIRRMCAEIRDGWSELTHKVRSGRAKTYEEAAKATTWSPPLITATELDVPQDWFV